MKTRSVTIILIIFSMMTIGKAVLKVRKSENRIDYTEKVELNGASQYISIKGNNSRNPILLAIHGGPGDTSLPMVSKYNQNLENHYTVVVWEQRGAGKSYYKFEENHRLTIDTFVSDAYILSKYLLEKFNQEKLYITAHSWGSVIGLKFIRSHPEIVHAYVGCGQVVNMEAVTICAYNFALQKNIEADNKKNISKIKGIDASYTNENWFDDLMFITQEVVKHGGSWHGRKNYDNMVWDFIKSPEYSFYDIYKRQKGCVQAIKSFWPELMKTNFEDILHFQVPVIFIEGKHDNHVSSKSVEAYYNRIETEKSLYIFDNSAHFPQWEECDKYNEIMISLLNKNI
jgi:pimeloyl-ACP methyl ester carboxylesterase